MWVWVKATFLKMVIQFILTWWLEVRGRQSSKINLLKIKWFKKLTKIFNNQIKIIKLMMSINFILSKLKARKKKILCK